MRISAFFVNGFVWLLVRANQSHHSITHWNPSYASPALSYMRNNFCFSCCSDRQGLVVPWASLQSFQIEAQLPDPKPILYRLTPAERWQDAQMRYRILHMERQTCSTAGELGLTRRDIASCTTSTQDLNSHSSCVDGDSFSGVRETGFTSCPLYQLYSTEQKSRQWRVFPSSGVSAYKP